VKATGETILIIEDETDMAEGLRYNLELEGFVVQVAGDGRAGLARARTGEAALILLDLMLPGLPGLQVLRQIREAGMRTPVIVLTARGQDHEKVTGLELGGDDYVTKPFRLAELLARIRAVLRRSKPDEAPAADVFTFKSMQVDFRRYVVQRDGEEHALSKFEAEILRLLIARRGEVVTRRDLLAKVWGYKNFPTTRTVDNHIARLRKKVEDSADEPKYIITLHGIGYRFIRADEE
jgi:two-component system alkaline phosphatase synthesis response regulator PhoP